jgi:periplasmic divalent cation tolerance protein
MTAILAYITIPDRETALRIGKALVELRLVACINIIGDTQSIYRWKGVIEEAKECVLFAKTTQDRTDELIRKVQEMHPATTPCVVFWPLTGGNTDYLEWIRKETWSV